MRNLEYMHQKIYLKEPIIYVQCIEDVAKFYFQSLGYICYKTRRECVHQYIKEKFGSKSFKQLLKLLSEKVSGIPDLVCIKNGKYFFVEVKRSSKKDGDDGLRPSQLKWIDDHPYCKVIVLCLDLETETGGLAEMHKLTEKIKDKESEIADLKRNNQRLRKSLKLNSVLPQIAEIINKNWSEEI